MSEKPCMEQQIQDLVVMMKQQRRLLERLHRTVDDLAKAVAKQSSGTTEDTTDLANWMIPLS